MNNQKQVWRGVLVLQIVSDHLCKIAGEIEIWYSSYNRLSVTNGTVAHNFHGKTKNLTAKTKYLTAKTKYLTTKPKTSRQNQRPHGKTKYTAKTMQIPHGHEANTHGKTKAILLLLWSIWFCREVFGFAVRYFVFAVRFLVLPWQLWATIPNANDVAMGN